MTIINTISSYDGRQSTGTLYSWPLYVDKAIKSAQEKNTAMYDNMQNVFMYKLRTRWSVTISRKVDGLNHI